MAMTEKFTADDRFLCFNAPSLFEAIEKREKKPHQQQWNKYYFPAGRLYLSLRRHSQMPAIECSAMIYVEIITNLLKKVKSKTDRIYSGWTFHMGFSA